jgi:hypothetical protein
LQAAKNAFPIEDLIPDQLKRGVAGRRIDGVFGKVQGKSGIAFCRPASLPAPPVSNASLRQRRSNPWSQACSFLNSNYFKLEVSFSTALHSSEPDSRGIWLESRRSEMPSLRNETP